MTKFVFCILFTSFQCAHHDSYIRVQVSVAPQTRLSAQWFFESGEYIRNEHNKYLSTSSDGRVFCAEKGNNSKWSAFGPVREGVLSKKSSGRVTQWQPRYWVLSEKKLAYWHTAKEYKAPKRSSPKDEYSLADLKTAAVDRKEPNRMTLEFKKKILHLQAESETVFQTLAVFVFSDLC